MSESLSITYLVSYDPFIVSAGSLRRGGEENTRDLALEMVRRGHDVTVVHSYVNRRQQISEGGVRAYGVPNHQYPYVGGWTANLAASKFLSDFGKGARGDILDIRGAGLGWAFHRSGQLWSAGVLHAVDVALEEWRCLPLAVRLLSAPRYLMAAYNERLCVRAAEWIVVDTASVGRKLAREYPGASEKWMALPPAIPRSWAPPKDVSYDPSHFLFIAAGPRRDTELFLHALRLLSRQGVPVKATVLREERPRFRALVASWKLDVRFAIAVSEKELQRLLAESCAFVLPSFREAYCRPIIEAAFHGTPSVVSNLESVREFVRDGETGLVVESWNPTDWARQLELLIRDPGLRDRLGGKARSLAIQNYSAERISSLTEQGYRGALKNHGS